MCNILKYENSIWNCHEYLNKICNSIRGIFNWNNKMSDNFVCWFAFFMQIKCDFFFLCISNLKFHCASLSNSSIIANFPTPSPLLITLSGHFVMYSVSVCLFVDKMQLNVFANNNMQIYPQKCINSTLRNQTKQKHSKNLLSQ